MTAATENSTAAGARRAIDAASGGCTEAAAIDDAAFQVSFFLINLSYLT